MGEVVNEVIENTSCFPKTTLKKRLIIFFICFLVFLLFHCWSWGYLIDNSAKDIITYFYSLSVIAFWISTLCFYNISTSFKKMRENILLLAFSILSIVSVPLMFVTCYLINGNRLLYFIFMGAGSAGVVLYLLFGFPLKRICCCCCSDDEEEDKKTDEEVTAKAQNLV